MYWKEIEELVKKGEGINLEFKLKANHPKKIVREMIAFANTKGGILLIGLSDEKRIVGSKFIEEDEYVLKNALEKHCSPPLVYNLKKMMLRNERGLLIFEIPPSTTKPHYLVLEEELPKVYIRTEDCSVQASKEMRQILQREKQEGIRFTYGKKEKILMEYIATNQRINLLTFMEIANIPRWLASRTLVLLVLANVLKIMPSKGDDYYLMA